MLIGVCARGQSFSTMLSMIVFLPSLLLSGIMFPASMHAADPLLGRTDFPRNPRAASLFTGFLTGSKRI
jgi:hypothetical protein